MKSKLLTSKFHISLILILMAMVPSKALSQQRLSQEFLNYIEKYKDLAIEQMHKYNIPASITLAQGLLESGAGTSLLSVKGNNHFGIKCHEWTGPTMIKSDDKPNDCFRVYNNPRESYEDHSAFLHRSRYQTLYQLEKTDYKGWAYGLKACGYATSKTYAPHLIQIIETYQLYKYDNAQQYHDPVAIHTNRTEKPDASGLNLTVHQMYSYNRNYYVRAKRGDTFESISKETGVSPKNLAKYNELDATYQVKEGDIIYLKKKQKNATKEFANRPHIVRNGESMYSIAQMYGIQLSSLYKKNHLDADYSIKVGDKLIVY